MLSLFKRTPVYVKLFKNKVEIVNLETGETISRGSFQTLSDVSIFWSCEMATPPLGDLGGRVFTSHQHYSLPSHF